MSGFNIFRDRRLRRAWRAQWLVLVLILLGTGAAAHAVDGSRQMSQYLTRRWGTEQGLSGAANAIAQTPDGYLWIGTDSGLYRFDGLSFRRMKASEMGVVRVGSVVSLQVDARGVLWIWMRGTHIRRYQGGVFTDAIPTLEDEPRVTAMGHANGDGMLISTLGEGLVHAHVSGVEKLVRLNGPLTVTLAQTTEGRIWLGTREVGLMELVRNQATPLPGPLSSEKINCLLPIENGRMWIGTDDGLTLWNGSSIATTPMPAPLNHTQVLSLLRDRQGNLWVGTGDGLIRYNSRGAVAFRKGPESAGPVTSLFEDREGNLWVGTPRGIERLRDTVFATFSSLEGLPGDAYGPVYVDSRERTWLAPKSGGLAWMRDGVVHHVSQAGLDADVVYSIDGKDDDLWLGRQQGGLTRLHLENDVVTGATTYALGQGSYPNVGYAVHLGHDGSTWVGTLTSGATHVRQGVVTHYDMQSGLASNTVTALEEGTGGAMWFGTPAGLSVLWDTNWRTYTTRDGLPSDEISCLYRDAAGVVWIGTAAGLAYFDNTGIHSALQQSTALRNRTLGIAEDAAGWLWLATGNQIVKIRADKLLRGTLVAADMREYGPADGLRGTSGVRRSRSIVTDNAGRIWISTDKGLSEADPANGQEVPQTIVHIEDVRVDGQIVQGNGKLRIVAAQKRITFHYTGLSLASPDSIRFRYRLDGFDRTWSDPVAERQAIYTNLAPGDYRFHVIASNSEGEWSESEDTAAIQIQPLYWQTWQFRTLLALVVVFFSFVLFQIRMQKIVQQANRMFDERLAERTRIAQELHDTLLQGFFSASMQLRVIADKVPEELPARPQLDRIVRLMGRVLDDGRNAVKGLRSSAAPAGWLEDQCGQILRETTDGEDVAHALTVAGVSRELRPGALDEIVRIVQEAVSNANRHAQAKAIRIDIEYKSKRLTIAICDDGVGIEPRMLTEGREGHWGLHGMRERAEAIGAKLAIASVLEKRANAAKGTHVTLIVPGHVAYRRYSSNMFANLAIELYRSRKATDLLQKPEEPRNKAS